MKSLNWNDLRIFLEVGRNRTLSHAAQQLAIDDSTVSRRIAHLEYQIGDALIERDHQGIRLTPRGVTLHEYVQEMERGAIALAQSRGGKRQDPAGRVRVASMEGISTLYLSEQFVQLHARYPALHVELVTSSNMVYVNRREADIFLSFFPPEGRGLEVLPCGEFQLHLYASPAYLKARGAPASVQELNHHVFASYIEDLVQLDTVRWLQEAVPQAQVVFHSTSMLSQMFAAAAGIGLVMLPTFARAERFGLVRVLGDEISVRRTLWLSVHRDLQYAGKVKAMTAFLREIFNRDYPGQPGVRMP